FSRRLAAFPMPPGPVPLSPCLSSFRRSASCNKNYRIDNVWAILIIVTKVANSGRICWGAEDKVQDDVLIDPSEGPAFAVRRPDGASDVVLVCEHAARTMP